MASAGNFLIGCFMANRKVLKVSRTVDKSIKSFAELMSLFRRNNNG